MARRLRIDQEAWVRPWLAKRWTRRGSRNLLLQSWAVNYGLPRDFHDIYDADRWIVGWAGTFGFRIPGAAFDRDRARVLRLAAKEGVHLAKEFPEIWKWATRGRG